MPYSSTTQRKYGENPMKKKTGFKMKGFTMTAGATYGGHSSSLLQQRETSEGKTFEQLMEEGFSPKEAMQMIKHGAVTGEQPQEEVVASKEEEEKEDE
jgi:type II secretory pathway component PulF